MNKLAPRGQSFPTKHGVWQFLNQGLVSQKACPIKNTTGCECEGNDSDRCLAYSEYVEQRRIELSELPQFKTPETALLLPRLIDLEVIISLTISWIGNVGIVMKLKGDVQPRALVNDLRAWLREYRAYCSECLLTPRTQMEFEKEGKTLLLKADEVPYGKR